MNSKPHESAPELDIRAYQLVDGARLPVAAARSRVPARPRAPGSLYLKGPIDWDWLAAAGRLPGKALHVAIALRLLCALRRSNTVPLSSDRLLELGVRRHAGYRALVCLEQAGLVQVTRHSGRQPRVTVLDLVGGAAGVVSARPGR